MNRAEVRRRLLAGVATFLRTTAPPPAKLTDLSERVSNWLESRPEDYAAARHLGLFRLLAWERFLADVRRKAVQA